MAIDNPGEHLTAAQVEVAALDETTKHLLQCERCAGLVIHYAETRETTPLEQFPPAE